MPLQQLIDPSWSALLQLPDVVAALETMDGFLEIEVTKGRPIYPPPANIFRALNGLPLEKIKVVILGQDPYHGEGQADGLAFSVPPGQIAPPSLKNILKEIERDQGSSCVDFEAEGLATWASQGVLLLNTVLTVTAGQPGSHRNKGWEVVTDAVIRRLGDALPARVFMLWGNEAQKKVSLIRADHHKVLQTSHPSPLSVYRGFAGCGHFSQCNAFLQAQGQRPILW